ncbi:MAG TPA: molybdopterin-guanine dinucleotide biosynthesis protein B [Methylophilaceae bacterium]|nr:molybdopterin-guanine dinucleotide biosynthesis protein B [Methylophilaceae bacterium]
MSKNTVIPSKQAPLLGFCAYGSGSGKTTLLTSLIPELIQLGLRISVIKHAHHKFDIDHPGKDSYRLREAGAVQMMVGSSARWALMTELSRTDHAEQEPSLEQLLAEMDHALADLIVVEGFRNAAISKIEVYRAETNTPLLAHDDHTIIAIATDSKLNCNQPQIDLNDIPAIARFIMQWLKTEH